MTSREEFRINGWNVVADNLPASMTAEASKALQEHLSWVSNLLPARVCEVVRNSRITLHEPAPLVLMTYHWGPPFDPGVEVISTSSMLHRLSGADDWKGFFIHEFGHSFQQHFLPGGAENEEVKKLYQAAKQNQAYTHSSNRFSDVSGPHYALERDSHLEYFACLFCAFFSQSDWTPATIEDLHLHDPQGLEFLSHQIEQCNNQL